MVYVSTHAGKRHRIIEDAVLVGSDILTDTSEVLPMPDQGFIYVADGVGGNCGGDQASQFIITALLNWKDPDEDLRSFLVRTNDSLIAAALEIGTAPNMATTLTGICVSNENYRLIHIGNTRAYVKQGKYLKQVTSDHTTFNWLMSRGGN